LCLFNESEQKATVCDPTFDANGLFFNPINYFSNKKDEKIISIIEGAKFEICKKSDKNDNPVINDIYNSIDDLSDSNPILVFYTLK